MDTLTCPKCGGAMLDPVATGARLRRKRTEAGIHFIRDVSSAMGLTKSYVSTLELGKATWTPALVKQYETALREAVVVKEHRAALKAAGGTTTR